MRGITRVTTQKAPVAPLPAIQEVDQSPPKELESHTEMERVAIAIDEQFQWFWEGKKKGTLWFFDSNSGLWRPDGLTMLHNIYGTNYSEKTCDEKGRKENYNKALAELEMYFLTRQTDCEQELPESPKHLIPFQNGVYDLEKSQIVQYQADQYFVSKLPWNFNEKAKCDWFMKLFSEWVRSPQELIDILALCLYRGMPLQKAFMLLGNGANGKTMYLQILIRALGEQNTSALPWHEFGERFSEILLYKKLANIVDELKPEAIRDSGVLKRVTGESQIAADVKHKSRVTFTSYATQVVAMNILPPTDDKTDAFFRRIHLVDFPNTIPPDKQDRELSKKLAMETENYEGFLVLAVRALQKAMTANWVFDGVKPQAIEDVKIEYSNRSDTVDFILSSFCEQCEGEHITTAALVMHTNRMRKIMRLPPVTPSFIRRRMESAGIDRERVRIAGSGEYQFCWMDYRLDLQKLGTWYDANEDRNQDYIAPEVQEWMDLANDFEVGILRAVYDGFTSPLRIQERVGCSEMIFRMALTGMLSIGFVTGSMEGVQPAMDSARRRMVQAALKNR